MDPKVEEYFLLINGETAGPYTLAQLHEMWMDDKITLDTLFVRPGMRKCQPVNLILGMVINYSAAEPAVTVPPVEDETENPLAPFKPLVSYAGIIIVFLLFIWVVWSQMHPPEAKVLSLRAYVKAKPADLNVFNESEFEWKDFVVYINGQPPNGYKRKLPTLQPGNGIDLTLLEFTDNYGIGFQPWTMSVNEVWIGNEKSGYRSFRIRRVTTP